jgi:hypothetical protein
MPHYTASMRVLKPRVVQDQAEAFARLSKAQRKEVRADWSAGLLTLLPEGVRAELEDRLFVASDESEVFALMGARVCRSLDERDPHASHVMLPQRGAGSYADSGWINCGRSCHIATLVAAGTRDGEGVSLDSVSSERHAAADPWSGRLAVEVKVTRLRPFADPGTP